MNRYLLEAERLLRASQFTAAAELCRKSLKLQKDARAAKRLLADCHYYFGSYHRERTGLLDAAEAQYRRALEVNADHADAHNDLGALLLLQGRSDHSLDYFRRAVELNPKEPRYLGNLTRNLRDLDRLEEASAVLLALADVDRANSGAYLIHEAMLVHEITPDADYPARVRAQINAKLEKLRLQDLQVADPLLFPTSYFPLSYHGLSNLDIVRRLAALYVKACPTLAWAAPHVARWRGPRGKTKIGIASRFFRNHSIGNTSRGLVEMLDRERFDVTLIRFEPSNGDATARAMDTAADQVVTLPGGALERTREAVARLSLDILFYQDIGMERLSYFLAFARLAPVQLTSFGHPDTTGIPNLDFFVSAKNYEIPGAQQDYSEQLIELPDVGTLAYYHRPQAPPVKAARADFGLDEADHLYLCPQTLFKVQPVMDRIFQKILELDGNAKFVLIDSPRSSSRRTLEARMFQHDARLRDCVVFMPGMPFEKYLALVASADVLLDTVHFNGYNTTLEAFASGVPVVTLPGSLQRSRHGYGMYRAMGFLDLIAADESDYAHKATRVVNDAAYREHCRRRIVEFCGVLYQDRRFIAHMEDAFTEMLRIRVAELA